MIKVDCSLQSDLEIQKLLTEEELHLDFGFEKAPLLLIDPTYFHAFAETIREVKSRSVCLYKGTVDLPFAFSEEEEERLRFRCGDDQRLMRLTAFAEFLHRLVALFPEDVICKVLFDVSKIKSRSEIVQLLSEQRFPFIQVNSSGADFAHDPTSTLAICFPEDQKFDADAKTAFDRFLQKLLSEKRAFRLIPEALLNEAWQEIQTVITLPSALSPLGIRKLKGFEASGGTILNLEEVL